jgi:hypothetical protein
VKTWVCGGVWSLNDWEYENIWVRADDDTKRVNDNARYEAEKQAEQS